MLNKKRGIESEDGSEQQGFVDFPFIEHTLFFVT